MIVDYLSLFTAFTLGLLGGAHCIGMCGGIIGALTTAVQADRYWMRLHLILIYNLGRIISYVGISLAVYFFVHSVEHYLAFSVMRTVAGLLLIAMGLYIANWWRGLVYLEKLGGFFWRYIQPLTKPLIPVKNLWQALLLGMLWGWLPCGLIYSALAYSATADSAQLAALLMLSFALGTLPAVLLSGLLAERVLAILTNNNMRIFMALLMVVFGIWTLFNSHIHLFPPKLT